MITEHDLQEAIAECEGQRNPSSNTCMKLAAFYTIRDKMYPKKQEEQEDFRMKQQPTYSYAGEQDTEFIRAIKNVGEDEFISIMDELMTTLKAIFPRLYDGVMRKLTKN